MAGDTLVLVGPALVWRDPWGSWWEGGKVGCASCRTSKRFAQGKCCLLSPDLSWQWPWSWWWRTVLSAVPVVVMRWFGTGGVMLAAPLHLDYGVRVTGASVSLWPDCSSCFLPSQDWNLLLLTDKSFCAENVPFIQSLGNHPSVTNSF